MRQFGMLIHRGCRLRTEVAIGAFEVADSENYAHIFNGSPATRRALGQEVRNLRAGNGCYGGVGQGVGSLLRCLNLTFQYAIISLSS